MAPNLYLSERINPMTTSDTAQQLQKLAFAGNWAGVSALAGETALFNTRLLFITALELAAVERNEEATAVSASLNGPMAALIKALLKGSLEDIIASANRPLIADAWISLVVPVVSRSSEAAALQFALLAPVVADDSARLEAAKPFYDGGLWPAAAQILGAIPAGSPLADKDFFRRLGIALYRSEDYQNSAAALTAAADLGDSSPEILAYLTWLQEKLAEGGADHE